MSSRPSGLRFSPFTNYTQNKVQQQSGTMSRDPRESNTSKIATSRVPLPLNLKEPTSNRSSMDASSCSYNTLIIHDDIYRHSSGQNSVLNQLVKEMKLPGNPSYDEADCGDPMRLSSKIGHDRDTKTVENDVPQSDNKDTDYGDQVSLSKLKSKSQPDLSRIIDIDLAGIEALMKDNLLLKEQLNHCYKKVAKAKKLEEEVINIYRVHEELVQSCERREKLERAARVRLQADLQRIQDLNKTLKDEVDMYQSQLLSPTEHQVVIAQLYQQNKELTAAKERQDIELAAQRATLQEQRKHIGILDKALQNAQHNSRCLEDELRKTQSCAMSNLQTHSDDPNRSGSSTASVGLKWTTGAGDSSQLISRLDLDSSKLEQRRLNELAYRQNLAKSMEKTNQESHRMLEEARQDKMRYLQEFQSAKKKVSDLQNVLKDLESHVVEKDALIRALQTPNACSYSFDSWPLGDCNTTYNMEHSNHMSSSSTSLLPSSDAVFSNKYSDQQMILAAHHHHMSSYSPGSSVGGLENRLMGQPDRYNTRQDQSVYGQLARQCADGHLIKQDVDVQLSKSISQGSHDALGILPPRVDDIIMLERQGRCSQRMRSEVSNSSNASTIIPRSSVGSKMRLDNRGTSLPPPLIIRPNKKSTGIPNALDVKFATACKTPNEQSTYMNQKHDNATYQRLTPTKKSLLPTRSGRARPILHYRI